MARLDPPSLGVGDEALNLTAVAERLRFAVLVVTHGLGAGRRAVMMPLLRLRAMPIRTPTRLLIAPQDICTTDPTLAADIYAGYFAFGGRVVNAHGQSPFDIEPPSEEWAETLHGFGWLRHLRAADTSLARANANALVADWMIHDTPANRRVSRRPAVVARRLLSWLSQSPVILAGADGAFYRRLMRSMARQAALLQRLLGNGLSGNERLWAAVALAEAGLCVEGVPALSKQGSRALIEELGRQILPDGGHVSRNPALLVDLLLDLLPLRQAYAARGAEVPVVLLNAIDRMMPMLRMFRHGDGSLALFNGMGVTRPEVLATVLAHTDARAMPLSNAPYSGYQRVEAAATLLIADTGKPPAMAFSRRAHAGTLSFELTSGAHRLIVNCGAPEPSRQALREAARLTAAHSTLVLADRSSSHFAPPTPALPTLDRLILSGPRAVTVERTDWAGEVVIETSHDGYAAQGFVHRRTLSLAQSGLRLDGQDKLVPTGSRKAAVALPFAVRFHLHPGARPAFADEGLTVAITLPNDECWIFEAGGLPAEIEESVFFAGPEGPRRTEQIVIHADTAAVQAVKWSLSRVVDSDTARPAPDPSPATID